MKIKLVHTILFLTLVSSCGVKHNSVAAEQESSTQKSDPLVTPPTELSKKESIKASVGQTKINPNQTVSEPVDILNGPQKKKKQ